MRYRRLVSSLVFLFSLGSGSFFLHLVQEKSSQKQKISLSHIVASEAAVIERRLSNALSSTYILAQEVRTTKGNFPHFNRYAEGVMRWVDGVSNLQLAPKGIISHVYPLKGNEKAIGHNILVDDRRRDEALLAIEMRMLTLAGPFELLQGGIAVIGRNPVFITDNGVERFWGFTSALVFLDDLFSMTGLQALEDQGYSFTLSKNYQHVEKENIFSRSVNDLHGVVEVSVVNVPNATWMLRVSQPSVKSMGWFVIWFFGVAAVSTVLALLVYRVLQEPERLRQLVLEKTKKLEYLAFHDSLTGLMNRHLLYKEMEKIIPSNDKKNKLSAVLYIDLDDFKRINDTMGHDAGDDVLKEIAQRMKLLIKDIGVISRLGGDGFVILLTDIQSPRDAENIANQLMHVFTRAITATDRVLVVTASIGIVISPDDGVLIEDLLLKADLALYSSKSTGKHRYTFYNQTMQNKMIARLDIEEGIREGLARDQFYLAFQPIVCFKTNDTVKFEALIRWEHPTKGLLYPNSFIEISEKTGLIVPIGKVVLQKACDFINRCKAMNKVMPVVTVNVSPRQFSEAGFVKDVTDIVRLAGVLPKYIQLEITESVLMADVEKGIHIMNTLKQEGFLFLMDDFGTGYSSLSQLKQLPVSTLKIDRSFITDSAEDYKIVAAIVAMASELGINVIAEGIETETHLHLLKSSGCQFGQGYLFSRPMPEKYVLLEKSVCA